MNNLKISQVIAKKGMDARGKPKAEKTGEKIFKCRLDIPNKN